MYQFLEEHKLLSVHYSDFCCNDSCINQLFFIVHTLYKAFDAYPTLDVRATFLDMPKAFDKVWNQWELKSMGVSDSLLKLIRSFLTKISKSLTQWSDFRKVVCKSRCTTRVYSCSTLFSNIHKWFVREHRINCKILCWWYFSILSSTW